MEKHQLSPDVVDKIPTEVATISFTSGVSVNLGNELKPRQVKDQPKVEWNAQAGKFYTLIFTDPDNAPNRHAPTYPNVREWHHWLVGNIPGTNVDAGDTLTAYIGSGPPQGTGLHRYVYLVFQQTGKINFDEPTISNTSAVGRDKFSTRKFATKYNLGNPVAGNLYQAQWDDYVPTLYKQLGA